MWIERIDSVIKDVEESTAGCIIMLGLSNFADNQELWPATFALPSLVSQLKK